SASAGSANITGANNSTTTFSNNATAGSSVITLQGNALLTFGNSASAGSSSINSSLVGSTITFHDTSPAASANIVLKESNLGFIKSASAGSASSTMPDATLPGFNPVNNTVTAASSN